MFEVGATVICIDDDNGTYKHVKFGNVYAVVPHVLNSKDYVYHKSELDDTIVESFAHRFRLLTNHKNTPSHYNTPITPITYIRANGLNFNRGNIVKYATRAGVKEGVSAIDDLKKIIRYAEAEINAIEVERKITEGASSTVAWSEGI